MQEINVELLLLLINNLKEPALGALGGFTIALHHFSTKRSKDKETKFDCFLFFNHCIIGATVAFMFHGLIPDSIQGDTRLACVSALGVGSRAILGLVESKFANKAVDKLLP